MNAKVATVLSVIGVLIAGTAAAAVNYEVLDGGGSTEAAASSALLPATTAPAASGSTSMMADTSAERPEPDTTTFSVGEAGTVVVSLVDGVAVVESIDATPGWSARETSGADGAPVVEFTSTEELVTFTARVENGAIVPEVTNESLNSVVVVQPQAPAAAAYRDDDEYDDDDEYEHDDDDDDEYELDDDDEDEGHDRDD